MEVFLMIKRQKSTIFLDVKEKTLVSEVKSMLEGIVKRSPDDMRLLHNGKTLEDNKCMAETSLTMQSTKAQTPALLGLVYKNADGEFEELVITPVSSPPELPTQMKQQESPAAGS